MDNAEKKIALHSYIYIYINIYIFYFTAQYN